MIKSFLIFIISLFFFSCSSDDKTSIGSLNIPEVFRGEFEGRQTEKWAEIYPTYLKVDTDQGVKTITSGTNENFNDSNHYEVDLSNNEKLVLTYANGYVGITIFDSDGNWIISDYYK